MKDLLHQLRLGEVSLDDFREKFYPEYRKANPRKITRDAIYYSYAVSIHDHINEHELKRLRHSIISIRKFNHDIEIYLFCNSPEIIPVNFHHDFNVNVVKSYPYDGRMLNAWSTHRWYNLQHFNMQDINLLYVDSDTIFYQDPKYLFETYTSHDIYGKEERGFRHCPITGAGGDIRFSLDLVDACIQAEGGKIPVHKFCIGVLLFNNNIHKKIDDNLKLFTSYMERLRDQKMLNPIPNPRILDQYAAWVLFSRLKASNALFGVQDVTHGWVEIKHVDHFNPVLLHYTTKDEQRFVKRNPEYGSLKRDTEGIEEEIDPNSTV